MALLRAIVFVIALSGAFIFVMPVQWVARRRGWRVGRRIQTGFSRAVCAIIGLKVVAHGNPAGDGPRLIVANHVSWTDILALTSLRPLVFLAKSEVANWPVLGLLARLQGTIFVERGNRREIPLVNARLAERLGAGDDVVIFPEGTSSDGSAILKFNAAHFAMLRDLQGDADRPIPLTLAPAAILYAVPGADPSRRAGRVDVGWYGDMTFLPHLWRLMKRGGVICHIFFGEAVEIAGRDRKALAEAAESSIRRLLTPITD